MAKIEHYSEVGHFVEIENFVKIKNFVDIENFGEIENFVKMVGKKKNWIENFDDLDCLFSLCYAK